MPDHLFEAFPEAHWKARLRSPETLTLSTLADEMESRPCSVLDSISFADDSIINRGRPGRGLATSFSSNIGWHIATPRASRLTDPAPSERRPSVKSIVAWIEQSEDTEGNRTADDASTYSSQLLSSQASTPTTGSQSCLPQAPDYSLTPSPKQKRPTLSKLVTSTAVEEYSESLLSYKEAFTANILKSDTEKSSPVSDSTEFETDFSTRDRKDSGTSFCSSEIDFSTSQDSDKLADNSDLNINTYPWIYNEEGADSVFCSSPTYVGQIVTVVLRDPKEAQAFWKNIRSRLWISDEEMDL
jgi:hypothetical protein